MALGKMNSLVNSVAMVYLLRPYLMNKFMQMQYARVIKWRII